MCAQRQSLLGMNKIGLPVTNLPSSWCIYTNRERSAQACPHFIVNTNTPGVDGVSSCGKHTKQYCRRDITCTAENGGTVRSGRGPLNRCGRKRRKLTDNTLQTSIVCFYVIESMDTSECSIWCPPTVESVGLTSHR